MPVSWETQLAILPSKLFTSAHLGVFDIWAISPVPPLPSVHLCDINWCEPFLTSCFLHPVMLLFNCFYSLLMVRRPRLTILSSDHFLNCMYHWVCVCKRIRIEHMRLCCAPVRKDEWGYHRLHSRLHWPNILDLDTCSASWSFLHWPSENFFNSTVKLPSSLGYERQRISCLLLTADLSSAS